MQPCNMCGEQKPPTDFYEYHQSRCKECVKIKVRANRKARAAYYRSYDRARYRSDPERKANARACAKSEAGIAARRRSAQAAKGTEKRKAQVAVGNAIRDGRLLKGDECFFCKGDRSLQAHHPDYSKPFDIFWLCPSCHGKLHTITGDFQRGATV